MADRRLHPQQNDELESALRELGSTIDWPSAEGLPGEPDLASTIRARIEAMPAPVEHRRNAGLTGWRGWTWRPARRALILALVALLAVAAIAGAVGLGLPGLRLILGAPPGSQPPATPSAIAPTGSPQPGAIGASMGLGEPLDPLDAAGLDARAGFHVRMPADPTVGPPDAAYIDDTKGGQVTLLWAARAGLPATLEPGVGLLLSQFRGTVEEGFFTKAIGNNTSLVRLQVGGHGGFWLSGDPHIFFWQGPDGFVDDTRRWVGDVLLWSDGPVTYRLETALGRDGAVRIAESLP